MKPASIAFGFAAIPLYPSLIFLASVAPPGISLVPAQVAGVVLILALAGGAFMFWTLLRAGALRSELSLPIAVYLAGWIVATLAGLDPITGALFVLAGVLSFILHLAVARYYESPYVATVLYCAFLTSGLAVALLGVALLGVGHDSLLYREVNGRAVSTFIVPGEFAGYLCFLIPIGAGVALAARAPWLRALGAAAALCGCVALWLTYSRAGIYGLSVGAAFFVYMQRRRPSVAFALIVALALEARWLSGFNDHHNPGEAFVRLPIWEAALRTVALFPVTGTGPGAFRHVFTAIGPPAGPVVAFHAHSYPLTALAETGLVGMAAAVGLWWCFGSRLRSAIAGAEPRARLLSLALTAGFIATLVQSSVDFVQVVILACWLPCMALALASARYGTAGA